MSFRTLSSVFWTSANCLHPTACPSVIRKISLRNANRQNGNAQQLTRDHIDGATHGQAGQSGAPIEVRTQVWYNPDLISAYNMVPALIGLILQAVTALLSAIAIDARHVASIKPATVVRCILSITAPNPDSTRFTPPLLNMIQRHLIQQCLLPVRLHQVLTRVLVIWMCSPLQWIRCGE